MKDKPELIITGIPGWLQPHKKDHGMIHTEETMEEVMDMVSEGWTLANICRDHPHMPAVSYLRKWIYRNPVWLDRYYEAQMVGSESIVDELLDIADGNGGEIMEDVQRSQLRINTRWKLLEKWNKERYGPEKKFDVNVNIDLTKAMEEGNERIRKMNGLIIDGELAED